MRMQRWMTALGVGAALAHVPAGGQEVERIAGQNVAIYNLVGRVQVVAGATADVVVRITRGGADAARLTIQTGQVRGRSTLRVVFPEDEIVYPAMGRGSSTTSSVRADGTFGDGGNGSGDRVRVRGRGDGMEAWADLVVEVPAGRTLATYVGVGEIEATGVSGDLRLDAGSGSVVATGIRGSLVVETGSGGVTVSAIEGSLSVDTGSGGIAVDGVSGDEVTLDTGSGRVGATEVQAGRLMVDTGSGSVSLDGVRAPVVLVETGSGSVDIELLADIDQLDVDTGSGAVTVRAPEGVGGTVQLDTGSGGIDLDFPLEVTSIRRNRVSGRLGDGQGTIRIDTGSGAIRLVRSSTQLE